ncbi:hypothetical protein FZCC0188_11610 [Rhodobacterales bacterium FZCC0188]|nr:hypothetical protein [Rhodobacterales bacterium FZCC0188]
MTYICVLGPNEGKNKVMQHIAAELKADLIAAQDLTGPYKGLPSKIPIFYGISGHNFNAIQFYRDLNCDFYILDNAWTKTRGELRLRMHKNSFSYQHAGYKICKTKVDVPSGSKFLVLPPSGPRALFDSATGWSANIITQLSSTNMEYTSKPKLGNNHWSFSSHEGMKLSIKTGLFHRIKRFMKKKPIKNHNIKKVIQVSDAVIAYNSTLTLECIKYKVPFIAGIGAPFGSMKNKDFLSTNFSKANLIESYEDVLEYIQKVEFNVSQFSAKTMREISMLHQNVMSPREYDPRY